MRIVWLRGLPLEVAPGREATFLVLDGDPREDAAVLVTPREVWLRGKRLR